MNILSIVWKVTMNPDNANAETRRSLKEIHTKLVLQREKRVLDLIGERAKRARHYQV